MSILSVRNIGKRFPGVVALDNVSVDFEKGECHALMGENGAGKSTLGKIIAGIYHQDGGEILLNGEQVHFSGPQAAVKAGIGMVHQELLFAENMTVAENLCLGDLPTKGLWLDERAMLERASKYLAAIGSNIDPRQRLGDLSVSKQQLVQIAAGVGRGADILIFDEPTSSLSRLEADKLLELIRYLKQKGVTCIYVSHRLEEILYICDRVTVLRDGKFVNTVPVANLKRDELVRMMIGRSVDERVAASTELKVGETLLSVDHLSSPNKFTDICFDIKSGEIVGLAGLVGAGRTEVAEAIFGLDNMTSGSVKVDGEELGFKGPTKAMEHGLGLIPEDRKRHGLVLMMSAKENVSLPTLDAVATAGWIHEQQERSVAQVYFDQMKVKAPSLDASSLGLSGGNQQKLVLAKWLAANCRVLLIDEPTRGVDVGAKAEIHSLIHDLAAEGKGVLLISSELPELLALATRIIVMRDGNIVGELPANSGEEAVMRLMAGVK